MRRVHPAVGAAAACGAAFLLLPLAALVSRAPWTEMGGALSSDEARLALRLSLVTSLLATAAAVAVGFPVAWILARGDVPGRALLRGLALLPMVLPPVVGGVALLLAFGRRGLLGGALEAAGIRLPFTTAAAVVAEAFVALPFFVLAAESGLASTDRRYEEVAATLRAGPWRRFREVTLPAAAPALRAGAVLSWARALGEFGATITFAGNLPGRTQTVPLAVYVALETRPEAAVALSLLLVAVSLGVIVALRDRWLPGGAG